MSNRAVIDQLASWLEPLGFSCEIQELPDNKANLIATLGSGSGGLVLSGHTDTVPCNPERWDQDPFTLRDSNNRFYGLGATDMKGFFPVALAAIENLGEQLQKLKQPLIILATADEESSMSGARALAEAGKPKARYAVIGEPTGMRPIRMHKGITMASVRIQGLAGHSSNPALGHNALETMHEVLGELLAFRGELQKQHQHTGFEVQVPTLNPGYIHGGDNPNRICGHCEMHFDLRPLPGMHIDELHKQLADRLLPIGHRCNTPITLTRLIGDIEPFEEPATSALVQIAEKLTGNPSESAAFATEAPFLQALGMQTIVMGPGSINQAHQPNEYIEHSEIQPAIDAIQALILRCCNE